MVQRPAWLILLVPPALIAAGTAGYWQIEGWSFVDALYMSVITLTTVGFAEIHPLGTAGRLFTMALSLGGIFTMFFATTEVLRRWTNGELRSLLGKQRFERTMKERVDHVIVCGYGRMGRLVCDELSRAAVPFVVVDSAEGALADFALPHGVPVHGDATNDSCLKRAGIDSARALVAVLPSDADNLFITMSARLLRGHLPIVARAEEEATSHKLRRAGATRVISPYVIGGARVVQAILQPAVLDFIEVATKSGHLELQLEEIVIKPRSSLVGKTLEASRIRQELNVIVVGIRRPTGPLDFNPAESTVLEAGETLLMLGARAQLARVEAMARA